MEMKIKEKLEEGKYKFRVMFNETDVTIQYDSKNNTIDYASCGFVGDEQLRNTMEVNKFIDNNKVKILSQLNKEIED